MARFLIIVPHEPEKIACARAVQMLLKTGSHFLTNADFGCRDGDHTAWIVLEAGSKDEARNVVPPAYRAQARIIGLNKFTLQEIEDLLQHHA